MVNFHDPLVLAREFASCVNFMHCLDGLFIWEFFTTLNFEWEFITGKRRFRWTLLLYTISRIGGLGNAVCNLIGFNVTHRINCQQWIIWNLILGYTAFASASALMALRVIAVWNSNLLVIALAVGVSLTNIAFLIYGIATVGSLIVSWTCVLENTFQSRDNITVTVATDITLLIIMLIGLLRNCQKPHGLVRYLYVQGLIWVAAATIAEIPAAVFINLDLNDAWNVMFQVFAFNTMVICATRMYRSLFDYQMDTHSLNPGVLSKLRFKGSGGTATTTNTTALPSTRCDSALACTEGVELSLAEKPTRVGDEEAQLHKVPSLTCPRR